MKADVPSALTGTLTIGVPSASTWRPALEAALALRPRRVLVAWDAGWQTRPEVARRLLGLLEALCPHQARGLEVRVECWPPSLGKGIDDVLARAARAAEEVTA